MKYIKNFNNHSTSKINELYDDDILKKMGDYGFLPNKDDKKDLIKTTNFYSNRLNNMILSKIPFYKKGSPEVFPDHIKYTFGDRKSTLVIVIEGELINDKYIKDSFIMHFYIVKHGICLNPQDMGNIYHIDELLELLEINAPIIEKEFNITEVTLN